MRSGAKNVVYRSEIRRFFSHIGCSPSIAKPRRRKREFLDDENEMTMWGRRFLGSFLSREKGKKRNVFLLTTGEGLVRHETMANHSVVIVCPTFHSGSGGERECLSAADGFGERLSINHFCVGRTKDHAAENVFLWLRHHQR